MTGTRRLAGRPLLLGLGALALGATAVAPNPPPPAPDVAFRQVSSAVLACPEISVTEDSVAALTGLVAPGGGSDAGAATAAPAADGTGPATTASDPAGAPGSAVLRLLDADADLARVAAPGDPVNLLVAERSQPPILMVAAESWAPGAVAGVALHDLDGAGAGLASADCPAPRAEWWFVGAGSQLGRGAALLVNNPAQEPARFDITLHARSGPVAALAGKGISLGPQSHVRLRLDALAQDQDLLAVQVRATSGRVAAALRDVAVPRGESPRGIDFIPAAIAPTTRVWIAGIPAGEGSRDLVVVNPGTQFATLQTRLLTEEGPVDLDGLGTIAVPAGSVISTPVDRALEGRGGTLELTSDVPVTGGVRASWGGARRDLSWLSAVPPVAAPNDLAAAAAVPAGPGLSTQVAVVAPDAAVTGTLQVLASGTGSESVFTHDGPLARGEVAGGSGLASGGPRVLPAPTRVVGVVPVSVPAGSQRTIEVPDLGSAALAHLAWRSAPGSGPAVLSHLTLDPATPLATGYSWWPTTSAVRATSVREDVGTLAPAG
jgi:hypothetical protein